MHQEEFFDTKPQYRPYDNYIKSKKWKTKSKKKLESVNYQCQLCGITEKDMGRERLHVHHNNYSQFGDEPLYHLAVLCPMCHDSFHKHRSVWITGYESIRTIDTL